MDKTKPRLCACGCGEWTRQVTSNNDLYDYKTGDYYKYRLNHSKRKDPKERINERTITDKNGCLIWICADSASGYASVKFRGKPTNAHRMVWVVEHGEIPKGLCVLHKCDNRKCVNIDHLFLGTHKDNMQDMLKKNRQAKYEPEKNGLLSWDIVNQIRIDLSNGKKGFVIANKFNISTGTVSLIKNNKTWIIKGG